MTRLRSHFVCEPSDGPVSVLTLLVQSTNKKKENGNGLKQADIKSFALALCRTEDNS